jgi:predicted alpha/beta-hydrolase family hydrolase
MSKSLRKLAQKLSCMDTPWEPPANPPRSRSIALPSLRTPTGSSDPVTGSTSGARTPPHRPNKALVEVEDDEDDDSESSDEDEALGFGIHQHRHPTQQGPSHLDPFQ